MFIFPFRFLLYFTISFVILCFPVKNATVFSYLHDWTKPYTNKVINVIKEKAEIGIKESKKVSKELFSETKKTNIKDQVVKKQSAIKKRIKAIDLEQDSYTVQEREFLKKVLSDEI